MRDLVDREREQRQLREAQHDPPALVVLIGRRRVGKSFLLAHTLTGSRVVSFQGDEQGERQHLDLLAEEAGRALLGATALRFGTWDDALTFFGEQAAREPLTLVLDEFQWLKGAQHALDSIIQRHWDRWERERIPVTLVLSGSALTLMGRLLEQGAPLYGRATARPVLQPLDYRDAAAFAGSDDPESLLRRWAVLGGTPQYQVWAGAGELEAVIRERILTKGAPLYDDPRHVLREGEGIRDPGTYLSMLRAVAHGATQHNEIAQRAGVQTSNVKKRLARLEDLGYIVPRSPLAAGGPDRRSRYELSDPYFRFWFRYVARNRSRLEAERVDAVLEEIVADLDNLMGRAFEDCCRAWLSTYAEESLIGSPQQIGSWWSRDGRVEIDVVGVRRHRVVTVGSCKWRRVADVGVLDALRDHQDALGAKAARAKAVIFAREDFTGALRARAEEEDVLLVDARQLFA